MEYWCASIACGGNFCSLLNLQFNACAGQLCKFFASCIKPLLNETLVHSAEFLVFTDCRITRKLSLPIEMKITSTGQDTGECLALLQSRLRDMWRVMS